MQLHLVPQNFRKLLLHAEEGQLRHMSRFELHQDIYIALGTKVLPKYGAKKDSFLMWCLRQNSAIFSLEISGLRPVRVSP